MSETPSLLMQPPSNGWTNSDCIAIAGYLADELSDFLENSIGVYCCDQTVSAKIQMRPEELVFSARSKKFDRSSPFCIGGIVSARTLDEIEKADAIIFLFVFGQKVSFKEHSNNLELSYIADSPSKGNWNEKAWLLDEFGEYENFDFNYFESLQPFSVQKTNK